MRAAIRKQQNKDGGENTGKRCLRAWGASFMNVPRLDRLENVCRKQTRVHMRAKQMRAKHMRAKHMRAKHSYVKHTFVNKGSLAHVSACSALSLPLPMFAPQNASPSALHTHARAPQTQVRASRFTAGSLASLPARSTQPTCSYLARVLCVLEPLHLLVELQPRGEVLLGQLDPPAVLEVVLAMLVLVTVVTGEETRRGGV